MSTLELLRKIEWGGGSISKMGYYQSCCPCCRGLLHVGHKEGCALVGKIKELESHDAADALGVLSLAIEMEKL